MTTPPPTPPRARQNLDPASPQFGCIAVQALDEITGELRDGVVFVGNPRTGGHWAPDTEVADWAIVTGPATP